MPTDRRSDQAAAQRYEIGVLIGPCSGVEQEALMEVIADLPEVKAVGGCVSGRPWVEEPTSPERLREELMRCGALAISERADGCVPKSRALQIREIAHRTCWPEDVTL